jgi:DNA-binding transcriptional MerR regulator
MARRTRGSKAQVSAQSFLGLEDLAVAAGLHPSLVERLVDYGLLEPCAGAGAGTLFPASSVERLRSIMRLKSDLGVNLAGIAVILEMRERLVGLQAELARLRTRRGDDE